MNLKLGERMNEVAKLESASSKILINEIIFTFQGPFKANQFNTQRYTRWCRVLIHMHRYVYAYRRSLVIIGGAKKSMVTTDHSAGSRISRVVVFFKYEPNGWTTEVRRRPLRE